MKIHGRFTHLRPSLHIQLKVSLDTQTVGEWPRERGWKVCLTNSLTSFNVPRWLCAALLRRSRQRTNPILSETSTNVHEIPS